MLGIVQPSDSSFICMELDGEWYCFDYQSKALGSGAMGTVFLGYGYNTGRQVAIKAVREDCANNPVIRQRAREEAKMSFLHPNVLRIYGVCEYAPSYGPIYIVTEYVHGLTIDRYCSEYFGFYDERSRMKSILNLSVSALEALDYLHRVGVVHRDIKPSNVMVTYEGVVKLMDMGIAMFENDIGQGTGGGFIGTMQYAAPELVNGDTIDYRVDIYAMSITIFELLVGFNPFDADSQSEIIVNQLEKILPANLCIPKRLQRILRKASEKNRNERYSTAAEFADDIKLFLKKYA